MYTSLSKVQRGHFRLLNTQFQVLVLWCGNNRFTLNQLLLGQSKILCEIQSVTLWFRNFSNFLDSIGFGIEKKLVSKKVSDSVSEIFGIGKKIRIRFRSDFGYRHTLVRTTKDGRGKFVVE